MEEKVKLPDKIPIYEPYFRPEFKTEVFKVLETGMVSSQAPGDSYVKKCERWLEKNLGVGHAILMNNGTSATHCLILALKKYCQLHGIELSRIYVPNNCYVAVYNVVLYEYPLEILRVLNSSDIPGDWNFDVTEEYISSLGKNCAVLVVHNIGSVVDVPRLKKLRPDIIFLEDCCEGFTGQYPSEGGGLKSPGASEGGLKSPGAFVGTAGLAGSISFFPNKIVTAGEGGAFLTNDEDIFTYMKRAYNTGMTSERYLHDMIGYNYRITNLQAALLYPQLLSIVDIIDLKRKIFDWYREYLSPATAPTTASSPAAAITLQYNVPGSSPGLWLMCIQINKTEMVMDTAGFLDPRYSLKNLFPKFMEKKNIDVRPFFFPINAHEHLRKLDIDLDEGRKATKAASIRFMLPSYPSLTRDQVKYICDSILEFVRDGGEKS